MTVTGFKFKLPLLKVLTEQQLDEVHHSILRVLEETGLRIEHDKALKLLEASGCKVDYESKRVRFPAWLVEECIQKSPKSFRIRARNPKNDIILDRSSLYFATCPGMQIVDTGTWEPRPPTQKEFYDTIRIVDALDNPQMILAYYPFFGYEGVPPIMWIPEGFAAKIRNTSKPVAEGQSLGSDIFTLEMAKAVGTEVMITTSINQPLTITEGNVEALYRALQAGFPVRTGVGIVMGANSPATVAGTVVSSNAEQLAWLTLVQLIAPGSRAIMAPIATPIHMRTGLLAFGNIQESLYRVAAVQYWRRFGIPTMSVCGFTNSKAIDFQCAYERTILALIGALSGDTVIQLGGALYAELTLHPLLAILDDDIANMIGRFVEGVEVNEETLAVDLINEVGPLPGMYLDKEHTRKWWKIEQFLPKAADMLSIPDWRQKGKKSAIDYARERMDQILATHKPDALTPKQEEDISRILEEAREYYRKKGLL